MGIFDTSVRKLISRPVGNNRDNDDGDIVRVKLAMSDLGYYKRPVENGIIDQELDTAIYHFQADKDLKIDGYMKPGGETEEALVSSIRNISKQQNKESGTIEAKPKDEPKENQQFATILKIGHDN